MRRAEKGASWTGHDHLSFFPFSKTRLRSFSQIDLKPLLRTRNAYPYAIELVRSGKVDLNKLITHRLGLTLENAEHGFETMQKGEAMKIIFNLD